MPRSAQDQVRAGPEDIRRPRTPLLVAFLTAMLLHLVGLALAALFWGAVTSPIALDLPMATELIAVQPVPEPIPPPEPVFESEPVPEPSDTASICTSRGRATGARAGDPSPANAARSTAKHGEAASQDYGTTRQARTVHTTCPGAQTRAFSTTRAPRNASPW